MTSKTNCGKLILKGCDLVTKGKYTEAIECYDKVLAVNPDDEHVIGSKGDALLSLGKPKDAMECFDKSLAIKPDNIYILILKRQALYELEKYYIFKRIYMTY